MMRNLLMIWILLMMLVTRAAHAHEMRVREVHDKEAVIEATNPDREMRVREGDDIGDGWKASEITESIVTIEKEIQPGEIHRAQMPVGGLKRVQGAK